MSRSVYGIVFQSRDDIESGLLEPEAQAPSTSEQVDRDRPSTAGFCAHGMTITQSRPVCT
jgi:hypothetical protein